ncbi:MAG: phosphatidylglycerol lysyltransferase domain-containing protein [Bacillota bacterium]|nr:phosphatidylglycerol lysyltransferase domain-containing protein [Bacillota bacterium]
MISDFTALDLSHKKLIEGYLKKNKRTSSDNVFNTLFLWQGVLSCQFALVEGFLCICANINGKPLFYMPSGEGNLGKCLESLKNMTGDDLRFTGINFADVMRLKKCCPCMKFVPVRDYSDYIYRQRDLACLPGKKYHAKKNHINKFMKLYGSRYSFLPVTICDIPKCRAFMDLCLEKQGGDTYEEKSAMDIMFDNFGRLDIQGAVLRIDGKICAMTFSEALNEKTALVHVEKADKDYEGIFAAINMLYARDFLSDFMYINREEDMGIPGLRRAKESYHPVFMAVKYRSV